MKWMAFGLALITAVAAQAPGARATLLTFATSLSPEADSATGSGNSFVTIDTVAHTLQINIDWSGLSGTATVAHIHCCTTTPFAGTVGVAVTPTTLPGFPPAAGLHSGSYVSPDIDLTLPASFTSGFVTNFAGGSVAAAEAVLIANIEAGKAYVNVHSTEFPGGEIRGFLVAVPEPSSLLLLAGAFVGMIPVVRRRYSADRA